MKRNIWRSILAVIVGAGVSIVLSLGTDELMKKSGVFPVSGKAMSNGLFALATVYRTVYGVLGAYLTTRGAPNRPMVHALILGAIGTAVGIVGVVATWNQMPELGPRWVPHWDCGAGNGAVVGGRKVTRDAIGGKTGMAVTEYDWPICPMLKMAELGLNQCLDKMGRSLAQC